MRGQFSEVLVEITVIIASSTSWFGLNFVVGILYMDALY